MQAALGGTSRGSTARQLAVPRRRWQVEGAPQSTQLRRPCIIFTNTPVSRKGTLMKHSRPQWQDEGLGVTAPRQDPSAAVRPPGRSDPGD